MTALYESKLNTLLNKKSLLYNELKSTLVNVPELCNTIVKLDKLGYMFKDSEYDKILSSLLYFKGHILKREYVVRSNLRNTIVKIVFKKFNPSALQIDKILNVYDDHNRHSTMAWAYILIDNGYKFNENHRLKLLEIGFDIFELYNGVAVQEFEIKKILEHMSKMSPCRGVDYTHKIKNIIDCNKSLITSDSLNHVLSLYRKPLPNIYINCVRLIITMVNPDHETSNIIIEKNIDKSYRDAALLNI